jgi:hypothetical protein
VVEALLNTDRQAWLFGRKIGIARHKVSLKLSPVLPIDIEIKVF